MKGVTVARLAGFDNLSLGHALLDSGRLLRRVLHNCAIYRVSPLRRTRRLFSSLISINRPAHQRRKKVGYSFMTLRALSTLKTCRVYFIEAGWNINLGLISKRRGGFFNGKGRRQGKRGGMGRGGQGG